MKRKEVNRNTLRSNSNLKNYLKWMLFHRFKNKKSSKKWIHCILGQSCPSLIKMKKRFWNLFKVSKNNRKKL